MLRHLNEAAELEVLGTRNADEGLHTIPVGAAVCGQLEPCPGFGGQGIVTTRFTMLPAPSYSVLRPVALSAIQNGLAPGENATPRHSSGSDQSLGHRERRCRRRG